jgi:hypothetical protein
MIAWRLPRAVHQLRLGAFLLALLLLPLGCASRVAPPRSAPATDLASADLETVIRPQLDRLGSRIADLLVAQSEPLGRSQLELLAQKHWHVEGLGPDAVSRLIDALETLLATTSAGQRRLPRSALDPIESSDAHRAPSPLRPPGADRVCALRG